MPTLASEIARAEIDIKQVYQAELLRSQHLFMKHLGSEEKAWAVMCQLVGAILMARSMADESVKLLILESSKQCIKAMLQKAS